MTEYIGREEKCGDCIHVEVCERNPILTEFSRENPAYCKKFMKAADVAPVRHARWELTGADKRGRGGNWKCTGRDGCGKSYPYRCDYCPNCGAKMDGGED